MKEFENFCGEKINLSNETLKHIKEIRIPFIRDTLSSPDEVRKSSKKDNSELYYLMKKENRYICVVVKICKDGNFISTALTTSRPKIGVVVYRKGDK